MARSREAPGREPSVENDGHHHQAVELSEEFVDFIERRLFLDQLLHVLAEPLGQFAVDENLALRVLVDVMAASGSQAGWSRIVDKVRRGGKLSEALGHEKLLPAMAVRTLRLAEETNQLPTLAARVADYFEARLDRNIDRIVGVAGPVAILVISAIVGGLVVSVMTALLSVNQMVE